MSKSVTHVTGMALAFINATAAVANSNRRLPWMAKRVMENCDRERVGLVQEYNQINISGTPQRDIDSHLRKCLPGLCGELR
jgi:hypothetical protein